MPAAVIRDWKTHRKVMPAGMVRGRGRGGQVPLYRIEDLRPLAQAYIARKATRGQEDR